MRRLIVLVLTCWQLWAQGQPAVDPSTLGHVEGRVLNAVTGEPLRKANLTLHNGPADYSAISDANGHFVIERIQPGSYDLTAEHQNFAILNYGATRPGMPGRKVSLSAGQNVNDIEIKLTPFGVISGKVVDADGDPVSSVQISVMRWGFSRGGRQLMPAGGGNATNDRGEYRIYNLPAGRYYVIARPPQSESFAARREFLRGAVPRPPGTQGRESLALTFFPTSPDPSSASAVVLTAGQEAPGTDIQLRRTRMSTVQGRVSGVQKGRRYSVTLQPLESPGSINFGKSGAVRPEDGSFFISGVTQGRYVLIASVDNRVAARQEIAVGDSDLEGVVIALGEPGAIRGRVQIDPAAGPTTATVQGLRISLTPVDNIPMNVPNAASGPDGSFAMEEISADRYRLNCSPMPGTYLKTIRWNGQLAPDGILDMSGGGSGTLDLVFAATSAQMEGDVKTADDQPAPGTTVLLIPVSGHESDFRVSMTDANGHFMAKAIAPGGYVLLATDAQIFSMPDATFLKSIEKLTTSVNVDENGHATTALKVVPEAAIEASQ